MAQGFEAMLSGGHPNSLGRTVGVTEQVLADPALFQELFACYGSTDPVVRLRVSSAMKRIAAARMDLLLPWIDRFIDEIGALDQPSAQWTLAQLFLTLQAEMSPAQIGRAKTLLQRNLETANDWIVLNMTLETLGQWASQDPALTTWLVPHAERLSADPRKSVAKRALNIKDQLRPSEP